MEIDPARKAQRMAEDIDMMQHPERWPQDHILCLKTQPWINKPGEWPTFGHMSVDEPLMVYVTDVTGAIVYPVEQFDNWEQLAERWSVD